MKYPQYKSGARWRARGTNSPFTFVIIGPGSKPNRKLCRIEYDLEDWQNKNFEQEYTHTHLQLHSKWLEVVK